LTASEQNPTNGPAHATGGTPSGAEAVGAANLHGAAGLPPPLPSIPAAAWIAWYSFRELARRRRLIFLGLMMALPVLVVVVARLWPNDDLITPELVLGGLVALTYIPFLVPVVALAVGASAIGEQIADGTIVYYWSRPLRRGAIYLGRLTAAQLVSATLLVLSLAGCFVATLFGRLELVTMTLVKHYVVACAVLVIGAWVYTALFAWLGTVVRRPLLPAILFAFGWEPLVSGIPQRVQEYTIRFHLNNLIERPDLPEEGLTGFIEELLAKVFAREAVPEWQSLLVLFVVLVGVTALGIWALGRKEIAQKPG
jgi:hypothetical protein